MKFAICNEIFKEWKRGDAFDFIGRTGYDAVELAPFTIANSVMEISDETRRQIRDQANRAGIAIAGIHWVLVKPEGLYMNHPDSGIRQRTAQYFCALTNFCADVGGKVMVVGSPKQRNIMPGVSAQQAWDWALDSFRDAVKLSEDRGVTICFEPLAPAETNFVNTAEDALRFTRELNSRAFRIILDVKAMSSEAKPIPQIIEESWPNFAHFHANDKNMKGPGFGDVDFKPIAAALKRVGYDGYVSVEVFKFEEGAEAIASQSLKYLKETFS